MSSINGNCTCMDPETEHKYEQIANAIDLYKDKEGSLIQVLHIAQEVFGHLPLEVQEFVAHKMNIPLSEVSGVVTFYSFFSTRPASEHTIRVCMGTACYVRGGKKIVEELQKKLGIEIGEATEDGKFSLEVARCVGACGLAPVILVDDDVYKQVSVHRLDRILDNYKGGDEDE